MTGASHTFAKALAAIDTGLLASDRTSAGKAREASKSLLAAQLRAGQHTLTFGQAMVIAGVIGVKPRELKAGVA